jgi:glycosyltransferase involved in cell wall biosynthesis
MEVSLDVVSGHNCSDVKKILAPIQKNDGCSFFRIETPARYLTDFSIEAPVYSINKFAAPPVRTGIGIIDRITGSLWDRNKLRERVEMVGRQSSFDAFWLSRSLASFPNRADRSVKDLIYDVDDAVWLNGEADHCFEQHCRNALVVFAGNSFLADHASKYTQKIEIVPTSVDLEYHHRIDTPRNSFNVGWIGSAAGLGYLQDISGDLFSFFDKHNDVRLVIVAERYPGELKSLEKHIDYIPWSRQSEINSINLFDIGIMPLRNTDWERGKCSFKMLQYMACEIPVVVSPVGMNTEVMKISDNVGKFGELATTSWADVLEHYYLLSETARTKQGKAGRQAAEKYSTREVASGISQHFQKYL